MSNTRETFEKIWNSDLFELLLRKEKFSEYIDWTYEEHVDNLINEIQELKHWIKENDSENIVEEFMDVVYMVFQLSNKLNKDWLLDWLDFKNQKEKIFKRSPNLKQCTKISREIENKIWKLTKSQWNH